jgi:hypothetical protein
MADGKQVLVQLGSKTFRLNWELVVDADTSALVGFEVSPTEDSDALLDAVEQAIETIEGSPVALLTDNLPANHAPRVEETLKELGIISMPSTVCRPETKSTVEGAFGLFAQRMPDIVLPAVHSSEDFVCAVLRQILFAYAAGRNHTPRKRLGGRTPAQAFADSDVTEEQRAAAAERLLQIKKRIIEQRDADRRRTDPACRKLIGIAFRELGLSDPEGRFTTAIARYGMDAALEAISIYRAKVQAGTPPVNFPERYLLGIARNVAHRNENLTVYEHLLQQRLQARDLMLRPLINELESLRGKLTGTPYIQELLQRVVSAQATIDRRFWMRELLASVAGLPEQQRAVRGPLIARRIACTFSILAKDRNAFIAKLTAAVAGEHR